MLHDIPYRVSQRNRSHAIAHVAKTSREKYRVRVTFGVGQKDDHLSFWDRLQLTSGGGNAKNFTPWHSTFVQEVQIGPPKGTFFPLGSPKPSHLVMGLLHDILR